MKDWSGVFGKAPEARDFIANGVPVPVRRGFDRWLTNNVVGPDRVWPVGGLRGLLTFDTPALFIAVASQDKVGRRFPLAALTDGTGLSLEEAEQWCDAVYESLMATATGDGSLSALSDAVVSAPLPDSRHDTGEDAIWIAGKRPAVPDTNTVMAFLGGDEA